MAGKKDQQHHPKNTARQKAWMAMRIMRKFSVGDIEATAEVSRRSIQKFISVLVQCGYVKKLGWVNRGKRGGYERLLLIEDTGPSAPLIRKGGYLRDLNTGEIIHPEKESHEEHAGGLAQYPAQCG